MKYKATLTQSVKTQTSGLLEIGKLYRIETLSEGDDFSNCGAEFNSQGEAFKATSDTPAEWSNGSVLLAIGEIEVTILKNTLGFTPEWKRESTGWLSFLFPFEQDAKAIFSLSSSSWSGNIQTVNSGIHHTDKDKFCLYFLDESAESCELFTGEVKQDVVSVQIKINE